MVTAEGLHFSASCDDLIASIVVPHKEFQFRYPQKASKTLHLMKAETAVVLTDEILQDVFRFIGYPGYEPEKDPLMATLLALSSNQF